MTDARPHRLRSRGRWTLIGLFLVFLVPVIVAWLLNVERPAWLPTARANHGALFRPPVSFPLANLTMADSGIVAAEELRGKWTLVYIEPLECLAECELAVYRTRQVRYALGKDMGRVRRLLVVSEANMREAVNRLTKRDGNIAIVAADPTWFERASFFRPGAEIYLVDPQGYLVLSYPKSQDPSGLISDLERLLKISKIG